MTVIDFSWVMLDEIQEQSVGTVRETSGKIGTSLNSQFCPLFSHPVPTDCPGVSEDGRFYTFTEKRFKCDGDRGEKNASPAS